nr:SdpI family protein [Clostridium perfringens]
MFFGNLAPKIPFNRYMGLRLPWTVRDEDTWRVAHRILGYVSFPIGIVMFVLSFFFKVETIVVTGVLTWIIIPSIYSLVFYYKKIKGMSI